MEAVDSPHTRAEVDQIIRRLRRIEGQVRGLQRMIDEGKECEAVLMQLSAVRAAWIVWACFSSVIV